MNPSARRADVIVQDVGPDTLVYDELRDQAHSLNAVAGYVYKHADGTTPIADLTARMSTELGVAEDSRLTEAALWQLDRVHLLESVADAGASSRDISRREAVRRFGTALAAAAVTSIVAPTPAMARSAGGLKPKRPKKTKKPSKNG